MALSATHERIDPVLQRVPMAAWAALPRLVIAGAVFMLVFVAFSVLGGGLLMWAPFVATTGAAVPTAWALAACSAHVFDEPSVSARGRYIRALVIVGVPGALMSLTFSAAALAQIAPMFGFISVFGGALTVVSVAIAAVALPLSTMRAEGLGAILTVSFFAAVRRPIPSLSVVAILAATSWAAVTWTAGLFLLVPALGVTIAFSAAWTVLPSVGVRLPKLVPVSTRIPMKKPTSRQGRR